VREFTSIERYWLWLNSVTGHNVKLFRKITEVFPNVEELFELASKRQRAAFSFLNSETAEKLIETAHMGYIEQYVRWLKRHEVDVVLSCSDAYPMLLKEIADPPSILFFRGHLPETWALPLAIIGTRTCTKQGERLAYNMARELTERGATVVSGMARGIDACAARGALDCKNAKEPTVAVLGSGIDVIYPPEHAGLYYEIIERGAVVSEFLPGSRPHGANFAIRNRIISGLSKGVIVVEAGKRSGTSITAGHALEQNRDVFAVPGRIGDVNSVGTNRLIQKGEAKLIMDVNDVLCEYDMEPVLRQKTGDKQQKVLTNTLTEAQQAIYCLLQQGEKNIDELCEELAWPVAQVNSTLTAMEFSGIIKQLPGRLYCI